MKYWLLLIFVFVISCKEQTASVRDETINVGAQIHQPEIKLPFEVYDYDGIEPLLNVKDDKVHVVNFWATWCGPCIKELPHFEKLGESYADKGVEMLLVSLDFPNKYETKLRPFLKKKNIKSKVVALDDVDQNRWIPAIDTTWSGALPATLIYTSDQRKFFEQSFTYDALEKEIKQFIN